MTNQDETNILGRWARERGFGPSPLDTASRWWLAPVNHNGRFVVHPYYQERSFVIPVTATGHEIIDVLELEDGLAKFRHYIVNPAGVRLSWLAVPQYERIQQAREITLRKKLQRLCMRRYEEAREPEGANIIAFPASRIVRRAAAA